MGILYSRLNHHDLARYVAVCLCMMYGLANGDSTRAAEPAAEFLAKLNERGYFDMVQAYNAQLKAEGIKIEGIGSFESQQAITTARLADQERDPKKRALLLNQAKNALATFIANNGKDPAVEEAAEWIRKIVFEQAMVKVTLGKATLDEEKKKSILTEGIGFFDEARQAADDRVEQLKKEIQAFRKLPKEKQDSATRQSMKDAYLLAKLKAAKILYLSSATLKYNDNQLKKRLEASAAAGKKLAVDYPNTVVAYHGNLIEGQSLKDLGKHKDAIESLSELAKSSEPALRALTAEAVGHTIDCQVQSNAIDKGIQLGTEWLKDAGDTGNDSAIQTLELALARAHAKKAMDLTGAEQTKSAAAARKLAQAIARSPGVKQQEAKQILAQLPGDATAVASPIKVNELASYQEAKLAGDSATEEIQTTQQMLGVIRGRLARVTGDNKTELEQEVATLEGTLASESKKVVEYYRQAIRLAPPETAPAEINAMRLITCYSYYGQEDYFGASVIGEFLARRFPDGPNARRGASIAMGSYFKMVERAQEAGNADEEKTSVGKLVSIANYLSATWPEQPEAQQALITLVQFMIRQGQLSEAQKYLARIPEDSPKRGDADLLTGQAMWSKYVEGMKAAKGASTPQLEALKKQSQAVLQGGVDRMKKAGPSSRLANAMLTLARIYNDSGDSKKAMALLTDAEVGPKTLLDQNHPSTKSTNFDLLCYKTVLQAQLGSIAAAKNKTAVMKQAEATMAQMAKAYGNDEAGKRRLISIFRSMATDLREQLDLAPKNQKAAIAQGFEAFLGQVQKASNEFNVLYWVAESQYSLGEAFVGPGGQITPQAKKYFKSAADAYSEIIIRSEGGKLELPAKYATQVRMKAASTKAQLGEFNAAVAEFTKILKKNSKMLNIQIEAANALKSGGAANNNVEMLTNAIKGMEPNPNTRKNTIWGWERIGLLAHQQMGRSPKLKETYFQAQYNFAHCRYLQSKASGEEKYLNSAKSILTRVKTSYPEMGGPNWKPKFEKLDQIVNGSSEG